MSYVAEGGGEVFCYALAQHGKTLATRPFAAQLRSDLVEQAGDHSHVELDFTGVLGTSHSFADEFVAQLAEDSMAEKVNFKVSIAGTAPNVEAVVTRALERRDVHLAQLA
jgi:STAS-like domain of unknown function (DUF4325)